MNWGILATGGIAAAFADDLRALPEATLLAAASRTQASADTFGDRFGIPRRYESYEALAEDPDIEIVYIATPHNLHYENTLMCLNAGKHVLCEKAFALNGSQVRAMVETARANNRFLMEAMWMWHIPATIRARDLIMAGEIGAPQLLVADFGFHAPFNPRHRHYNPALGGGTLLDIGIYPLALALFLFGKPAGISGRAILGETGVDEQMAATLEYTDGKMANLTASFRAHLSNEAVIGGTKGHLRIHRNFWHAQRLTVGGAEVRVYEIPYEGNGLRYEAREAMARIREGKLESQVMPWQASFDLIDMMDTLRAQWAVVYPDE